MAKQSRSAPIEPMTLGNMRANGVRSLDVSCWQCHHRVIMTADPWPDDVPGASIRAADGMYPLRDHRCRCPAELAGAGAGEIERWGAIKARDGAQYQHKSKKVAARRREFICRPERRAKLEPARSTLAHRRPKRVPAWRRTRIGVVSVPFARGREPSPTFVNGVPAAIQSGLAVLRMLTLFLTGLKSDRVRNNRPKYTHRSPPPSPAPSRAGR